MEHWNITKYTNNKIQQRKLVLLKNNINGLQKTPLGLMLMNTTFCKPLINFMSLAAT
jgi:hypothetical protein